MVNYPPYVNAYKLLPNLFAGIKTANVPVKFNRDFITTMLGLKSSSYNAMLPLLKNLGLLDSSNAPTQDYRDYRDESISKQVLAKRVKETYHDLFTANSYAHRLTKQQIEAKLRTILGVGETDKTIQYVAGTIKELCELSDFETEPKSKEKEKEKKELPELFGGKKETTTKLGINYTINISLPPTTDIEVFNAIFKSLKEHILND